MQDFHKLKVWQSSHELVLAVYRATAAFPRDEVYGLTSQIKRSAASIPANIAEGCGRGSPADLARFIQIAIGSSTELEYHLLLALDLGFLAIPQHRELADAVISVRKMLITLISRVRTAPSEPRTQDSRPTTP